MHWEKDDESKRLPISIVMIEGGGFRYDKVMGCFWLFLIDDEDRLREALFTFVVFFLSALYTSMGWLTDGAPFALVIQPYVV